MKKPIIPFALFLGLSGLISCSQNQSNGEQKDTEIAAVPSIQTIAFGSCNKHDLPQPLWEPILEEHPDVWIWLGDNVYGDTQDMELLKTKYDSQYDQEGYAMIRKTTQVIGTWDDHDFGINDGGVNFAKKKESQQIMLNFLEEPENTPRRAQEGVYTVHEFGEGEQKVNIYLLDTRYHRDTLEKEADNYVPNTEGTILGEEQWQWLEEEFLHSDARINIIASGIQFIAEEHPYEKWANFPKEREKLMKLIADSGLQSPVLISGDRHIGEMAKTQLPNGKDIYEITSSGLTHTWNEWRPEDNKYRVAGDHIAELHYGLVSIDWEKEAMEFSIKGEDKKTHLNQAIQF
ncbi:MAG: alkaline phosphatase D family protein [Cyclobacteriaceae bacterium]